MPPLVLAGLSATDPVPGNYFQAIFAAGPGSGATAPDAAIIYGNRQITTLQGGVAGDGADNTLYGPDTAIPCVTLGDWGKKLGLRSEAYRAVKRFLAINTDTPLYVICPPEGAGAVATLAITFSTTAGGDSVGGAAAPGYARFRFADEFVDVPIAKYSVAASSGDTPTTVAAAMKKAINGKTDWPFTADAAAGVLTLTSVHANVRGNLLRAGCDVFASGSTPIAFSASPSAVAQAAAYFSGGTGVDSWTASLAVVANRQFTGQISSDDGSQSSTGLAALVTQVAAQWQPTVGIIQRVFAAGIDTTVAAPNTRVIAYLFVQGEYLYQPDGDLPPSEMAAIQCAGEFMNELSYTAASTNYNGWGATKASKGLWNIPAPRCGSNLTRPQIVAALNSGVSPIVTGAGNQAYLVRRITMYSGTANNPDYRVRGMELVVTTMKFIGRTRSQIADQTNGTTIGDNVPAGAKKRPAGVTTPADVQAIVYANVDFYDELGLVDNASTVKANTTSSRTGARVQTYCPFQPAPALLATDTVVAQVSPAF